MAKTIYDALYEVRDTDVQRDIGTRFELATKYFLKNDPVWAQTLEDVQMWGDSRHSDGQDTGIDLTATDRFDGDLWAIQSKCYDEDHLLDYPECATFFAAAQVRGFSKLLLATTCSDISANLKKHIELAGNVVLVTVGDMAESLIDWEPFIAGDLSGRREMATFDPKPHQLRAMAEIEDEFARADRCKAIMACGTGKTLMSLRLAEDMLRDAESPLILFAAPSIALVGQSMREWMNQSRAGLCSLVVCSDAKASRRTDDDLEDSLADLAFPASTDPKRLFNHYAALKRRGPGPIAVFTTYQSMQVISDAQLIGLPEFDLVVCDEAHRTTGYTEPGTSKEDATAFVKVHDDSIVKAKKRLYMTATERIYGTEAKEKRDEQGFVLTSMDDEEIYGRTAHEITFAEAVEDGLLTDYRVVVLAIEEDAIPAGAQMLMSDGSELPMPDVAKIIGTWKGLAQHGGSAQPFLEDDEFFLIEDMETIGDAIPTPLHKAVGFASTIRDSKTICSAFRQVTEHYREQGIDFGLECELDHVDGTMDSKTRNAKLAWLSEDASTEDRQVCRILTNARCLAEGVDVPSLDAVIFFAPKKSKIDVVQAVGRVMRTFKGKKYGYIILPIFIPSGMTAEDSLSNSQTFDVVWDVLQALRSHDKRVDAYVNSLPFRKRRKGGDIIGHGGKGDQGDGDPKVDDGEDGGDQLAFDFSREKWEEAIFTQMVKKVGTRVYWDNWAEDVAVIAQHHIARLTEVVDTDLAAAAQFDSFLKGLRDSLNNSITRADAIEMVAQHMITLPVFDALFGDYEFRRSNPVSIAIEQLLDAIQGHEFSDPGQQRVLDDLYASVSRRARAMRSDAARQQLIKDLYNEFFAKAFRRTSDRMGIVYTPNEVVDYILHATDRLLYQEFGQHLCDEGVHILDPFTGTGTFIVNLLNDRGLMPDSALPYKYGYELHCNEIVLLAYYIASINIEHAYHNRIGGQYEAFPGAVLTDTFQMSEEGDPIDLGMFVDNTERVLRQMETPITVLVGNPPWSAGQSDANDNAANESYPTLDARIADTYAAKTSATNKNSLYDSYIRAFRWASDRIGDKGIVSFVTNGGWLRSESGAGVRRSMVEEFNSVYVFDLRGNQRTQGEESRREGGKIFGSGSRAPVTITMLVKNPDSDEHGVIRYHDIGDYLTQNEKLAIVAQATAEGGPEWEVLEMDRHGDWLNQRDDSWYRFAPMGMEKMKAPLGIFKTWIRGLETGRDTWVYGFSKPKVKSNMQNMIGYYNHLLELNQSCNLSDSVKYDSEKIKWSSSLESHLEHSRYIDFSEGVEMTSLYRPFCKQNLYFSAPVIHRPKTQGLLFPTPETKNLAISIVFGDRLFSALMTDTLPDIQLSFNGQCFPLYYYETSESGGLLDAPSKVTRRDAITDEALEVFRKVYPHVYSGGTARTIEQAREHGLTDRQARDERGEIAKADIFHYIYGILHSPEYRNRFKDNLTKELPRIPFAADFKRFAQAGRDLAKLHLGYEDGPMYPLDEVDSKGRPLEEGIDPGRLAKLSWGKGKDRTKIVYNANLTLTGIPEDAHRYVVNGKTGLEWLIDRYKVTTDKKSGIVNDPNEYSDDPRYVVDLIKRVTYVSVETMRIVDELPPLSELEPPEGAMPFEWTMGV